MTDELREELLDYKEELYVEDKETGDTFEDEFCLRDFADALIEKLTGQSVCAEMDNDLYDKWLQTLHDNFRIAVAYYHRDCYCFPDIENEILLGKLKTRLTIKKAGI